MSAARKIRLRHATLVVLQCVVLGAVSTVGVAWLVSATFDPATLTGQQLFQSVERLGEGQESYSRVRGSAVDRLYWNQMKHPIGNWLVAFEPWEYPSYWRDQRRQAWKQKLPSSMWVSGVQGGSGWPCVALAFSAHEVCAPDGTTVRDVANGVALTPFNASTDFQSMRVLPLRPVWAGLATNTAWYAFLWLMVLAAPGGIIGVLRRRRGACVHCGYDLRGSSDGRCPECGVTEVLVPMG